MRTFYWGGSPADNPTQDTDVQKIIIKKEWFDPDGVAKKDLELAVGDVYGKFTISRIIDTPRGPNWIYFSGEETIKGSLQLSGATGGIYFKADDGEVYKLPQIFKDLYDHSWYIDGIEVEISGLSTISRNDFLRNEAARSKIIQVEIKISHLMLTAPVGEFSYGSATAIDVKVLDN